MFNNYNQLVKNKAIQKLILSMTLLFFSVLVHALPPQSISYQGYLKNNAGLPVSATMLVTFRIYNDDKAGTLLWSDSLPVAILNGQFSVQLGGVNNLLPKSSMTDLLWLGIEVASDGEFSPRTRLDSVINSFHAENTDTVAGKKEAQLQKRISGACPSGQTIRVIAEDGSVTCEPDSDTTYNNSDFIPSNQACSVGMVVTGTDAAGNLICTNDVATNANDITTISSNISSHVSNTTNPHGVTEAQLGAASNTEFSTHELNVSAHHTRYTDSEAVAGVKSLDGAGSGLDADWLDSLSSSSLLRSDTSDAYTSGTFSFNSSSKLQLDGVVKIGPQSATDDDTLFFDDGVNQFFRWANAPHRFEISNDLYTSGVVTVGSTSGGQYSYNQMRDSIASAPLSGDMSNMGDLFIGYDIELGGEIYANKKLYMYRNNAAGGDADQNIYFYDNGSRQGQYIRWNDVEGRFDTSTHLRVDGQVTSINGVFARSDLDVTGTTYIGYEFITGPAVDLVSEVSCAGFGVCKVASTNVSCSAGKQIISGGCRCTNFNGSYVECYLTTSAKLDEDTWSCAATTPGRAPGASGYDVTATITCGRLGY